MFLISQFFAEHGSSPALADGPRIRDNSGQRHVEMSPVRDNSDLAPLAVVEVSEGWIAALAKRMFDESSPVNLVVLDTPVTGVASASGSFTLHCVDAGNNLSFAIRVQGRSVSSTYARNGPAQISTVATTDFQASKHVKLAGPTLVVGPTSVDATSLSRHSSVDTRRYLGRRLVRRIAHRRMLRSREEIDAIAESEAERRIVAAIDQEVEKLRTRYQEQLQRMQGSFFVVSWGDARALIHLKTNEQSLRFSLRDHGGRLENSLFFVLTNPKNGADGVRLWMHQRTLAALPEQVRRALRRLGAVAALTTSLMSPENSASPWSMQLLGSFVQLELQARAPNVFLRVPVRSDPILLLLKMVGP